MNQKKTLISIVTISYNHEAYIAEAMDSFLTQERNNFDIEIIVADDASTDGTQQIITDYAKRYPNLVKPILRKKNIGVRRNLLNALDSAKGKYIALCEGDDFWTSKLKLAKQYAYMESNPEAALCFHFVNVKTESETSATTLFPDISVWSQFGIDELLDHNFIQTNSVLYKNRFAYKDIVKGDLMPVDWFLHIFHAKDGPIGFIPEVLATYRRHENGVWWRTEETQKKFWRNNILKLITTYDNIINLFDGDVDKQRIVEASRIAQIINIASYDDGLDEGSLIKRLNTTHPKLILSGAAVLQDKISFLHTDVEKLKIRNSEQHAELIKTQELVKERDNQISQILNSKAYRVGRLAASPFRRMRRLTLRIISWMHRKSREFDEVDYIFQYEKSPEAKLAVIVHLYYVDLWEDISLKLSTISQPFDLYVSVSNDREIELGKVNQYHNETNLVKFPNRGRDVLPFLAIISTILKDGHYKYLLKIHSKKSKHRDDGSDWFAEILSELLPTNLNGIIKLLEQSDTGIIGPSKQVVSLSKYFGDNVETVYNLLNRMYGRKYAKRVIQEPELYPFIGGTMFWARADYFDSLRGLKLRSRDFPIEDGQVDGTIAHAIERIMGLAMHVRGKKMYTTDDKGNIAVLKKRPFTENYDRVG